jgi:hypothetical protein
VQNVTNTGVQCVIGNELTAGTGLTLSGTTFSLNTTYTGGLYYPLSSNPSGFYNVTTLPADNDSMYNDTALINAVNTTLNIQSLGFATAANDWINDTGSFYSISNPSGFLNTSAGVEALGFNTTVQLYGQFLNITTVGTCPAGQFINGTFNSSTPSCATPTVTVPYQSAAAGWTNDTTNTNTSKVVNIKSYGLRLGDGSSPLLTGTEVAQFDDSNGVHSDWSFVVAGGGWPVMNFASSDGTLASPTTKGTNATMGELNFYEYSGAAWRNSASIHAVTGDVVNSTSTPSHVDILTTAPGSTTEAVAMSINSTGATLAGSPVCTPGNLECSPLPRQENYGVVTSQTTTTSNTVYTTLTGLTTALSASATYNIECRIIQDSGNANTGVQLQVNTSGTAASVRAVYTKMSTTSAMETFSGTGTTSNSFAATGSSTTASVGFLNVYVDKTTDGNFTVGFRSETGTIVRIEQGTACNVVRLT